MAGALVAAQQAERSIDWKLTRFEKNKYEYFSPDLKQVYAMRDGVKSAEDFAKIENELCHNCPTDAPSMPHMVCLCPFDHENSDKPQASSSPRSAMSKIRTVRRRQQLKEQAADLKAGKRLQPLASTSYVRMVATATALDSAMPGMNYVDAIGEYTHLNGYPSDGKMETFMNMIGLTELDGRDAADARE